MAIRSSRRDRGQSFGIELTPDLHQQLRKDSYGSVGSFQNLPFLGDHNRRRGSSTFSVKSRSQSDQYFEDFCASIAQNISGDEMTVSGVPDRAAKSSAGKHTVSQPGEENFTFDEKYFRLRGQSSESLFDFMESSLWGDDMDNDAGDGSNFNGEHTSIKTATEKSRRTHYIGGLTKEERRAKINRWLEKRKKRNWSKNKTHYKPRQAFAKQRVRIKGRFVKIDHPLHPQNPLNLSKLKQKKK